MKLKHFTLFIIVVVIISLQLTSCGTILQGTSDDININSTPPKARVKIQSTGGMQIFRGNTPWVANLSKKNDYNVNIKLEGYQEQKIFVSGKLNAFMLVLDIFCGGLIGIVVDAVTGGWHKLEPSTINITLLTAYNDNGDIILYTVFKGVDEDGNPREYKLPLIKSAIN